MIRCLCESFWLHHFLVKIQINTVSEKSQRILKVVFKAPSLFSRILRPTIDSAETSMPTPRLDRSTFQCCWSPTLRLRETLLSLTALEVSVNNFPKREMDFRPLPVKLKLLALLADVFTLKLAVSSLSNLCIRKERRWEDLRFQCTSSRRRSHTMSR